MTIRLRPRERSLEPCSKPRLDVSDRATVRSKTMPHGRHGNPQFPSGRQIEHDPAKIAIVRRVAAQILFANPGVLVSHKEHLLALRLMNLNEGQIGPLIRPTGGASNILQERKNGLEGRSGCGRAGTPAVERRSAGSSSERSASRAAWSCPPVTAEPLELEPQLGLARSAAIARVTTRAVGSPSFSNRPVVSRQAAKKPPNVDAFAARPPGSSFHASRRSPTGSPLWGLGSQERNRPSAGRPPGCASFVRSASSCSIASKTCGGEPRPTVWAAARPLSPSRAGF